MARIWNKFIPLDKKLSNGTSKQSHPVRDSKHSNGAGTPLKPHTSSLRGRHKQSSFDYAQDKNTPLKRKVFVALSGGVDSAVSLYLLQKQGYEVQAAFMKNFSDRVNIKGSCPWIEDREEAYRVAAKLQVPIQTFDFQKEYHDKIVNYIFATYQKGQTPNPDVLCNNEIKFKLFLERASKLGFDKIATGHYAQIKQDKKGYHLLRGQDKSKDQSYFLSGLEQWQLAKALFPIGHLEKKKVRQIAKKAGLPNADRPDSQGICFIGKIKLEDFLKQRLKPKIGDIVDSQGRKIGQHQGVWYYTIGQRNGLNIGGDGPWYVAKKDIQNNRLVMAKADSAELYTKEIRISDLHWLGQAYKLPLQAKAQIRYRQELQTVTLSRHSRLDPESQRLVATFTKPQKGIASGQTLAIYKKKELIASGIII